MTRRRRLRLAALSALVVVSAAVGASPKAGATIVERVVAVIGERPVLWTDLLKRAAASRVQIRMQTHDPNIISAQEQEMYKELLQRMIDDRLEEQQADRAHVNVTAEEVDRGIENIAAQAQAQQGHPIAIQDIFAVARSRGMTEQDFRDEIRRQILEGKLIELRVRPRVRVTDQDAHAAYQHWSQDVADSQVDVHLLVKRIPPGGTGATVQALEALAQELARRAQGGEDFCQLVAQYSDDTSTRSSCGSHGPQPVAALLPAIQNVVRTGKPGGVSDPIRLQSGTDEAFVIVQSSGLATVPPFNQVKNEMMQRALLEGLERERKRWLEELRHNVYIDVRL
jgi:peptidyl-prolyl cis-trans isomerase SurA